MLNMKEALRIRAEYALWSGRKAIHQPRLKSLQSKYILEQDDVNRLERGLFSKWKRNYNEKLEKEKSEVAVAKEEWEVISALMKTADEKLPALERQNDAYAVFWENADVFMLTGEEEELFRWCQQAEKCVHLSMGINTCIMRLKEEQQRYSGIEEGDAPLSALQREVDLIWADAKEFIGDLKESKYDFYHLEEEDTILVKTAKFYPCRLTRSLAAFDAASEMMKTNSSLFGLEEDLRELREKLAKVFEEMSDKAENILKKKVVEESHFCEKDMGMPNLIRENTIDEKTAAFEGAGLFEQVDLTKEKERVLFGLDLLRKEFEKITPGNDRLYGWERALREWQQDLKQYRKNAGNFSCVLDRYEILDKKIWQYAEEDPAELQKIYREHLQDTAKKLEQAEEQIRTHER